MILPPNPELKALMPPAGYEKEKLESLITQDFDLMKTHRRCGNDEEALRREDSYNENLEEYSREYVKAPIPEEIVRLDFVPSRQY